ncbi:MAG: cupredoxin domain-containing protein [Pseudomonadota bacterium]
MKKFVHLLKNKMDLIFLILLISIMIGMPFGIRAYDRSVWEGRIPSGAKEFTLTGHAQKGWLKGEIHAYDAISLWKRDGSFKKPLIEVSKGDQVVFKLRSSDVVHGFSLKDFNLFITDGIQPGKSLIVSFKADKVGSFTFSCNAICGDNHQNMQGTLVVKA